MTFSIAGRCPRTGMLGAVVSTSSISVGSRCAWAEANVGAVLTQHRTDPRLGPKILERLKHGSSPEAIVHDLEKTDPDLRWRVGREGVRWAAQHRWACVAEAVCKEYASLESRAGAHLAAGRCRD